MATIQLGYGRAEIEFDYDPERFQVLHPSENHRPPLSDFEIGAALDDPVEAPSLDQLIQPGDSVLVIVSDATRATGSAQILNVLVRRLIENGVAPNELAILFATGIHRPVRPEEKVELLTPFIAQRIRTIDHQPDDAATLIRLDGDIEVNKALSEFDKVIITGGVSFHYFAGFTGGRKAICPGVASTKTITATHMLALDFVRGGRRPGVGPGLLDGNAVNEECERVAGIVAPTFGINAIVNDRGQPEMLFTGHWRAAHRRACAEYECNHSVSITEKRDVVIVACGGRPYDINLIQAHKALDMAAHACADGGAIIFVAECADGLGRPDFLKWFAAENSRALENRLREAYEVNGQTAWALFTKTERFHIQMVSSLDENTIRQMRMRPARSIGEALANVPARTSGYVMTQGAALLPIVKN